MSNAIAAKPGPGRPSTGARERILAAGLEVLKEAGYAGLTVAKVAAQAGESKALIAYHFGSKDGLIAACGRELGEEITRDVLDGLESASSIHEIVHGSATALWRLIDRDERLPRVYFDLNAVSVVEPAVRDVLREIKSRWRKVLSGLLRDADPTLTHRGAGPASTLIIAGLEGLTLERIERGDTADLRKAREMFVASATAAIEGHR